MLSAAWACAIPTLVMVLLMGGGLPAASLEYFVSPVGNDANDGSSTAPFATPRRAQHAIQARTPAERAGGVSVILREGVYELDATLVFTANDAGTASAPVTWKAMPNETPVISGGRAIAAWRRLGGNHWVAALPDVKTGKWYFRQLWADGKRLTRARIPNQGFYMTQGALSQFDKHPERRRLTGWDWQRGRKDDADFVRDAFLMRCGFKFKEGDIKEWGNWQEAEVITYHSWECSWQTIRKIDMVKNEVYMNSPCRYATTRSCRYRIENVAEALDMAGEWYLDGKKGELHYMAADGEDPNTMDIVAPKLAHIMKFKGDREANRLQMHLQFEGISFQYARYELGIYDIAPNWPDKVSNDPTFPKNPRPGFTDAQSAPRAGCTIEITDAQDITFEKCRIMNIGVNAIQSMGRSKRLTVRGCEIADSGSGGIALGLPVRGEWIKEDGRLEKDKVPRSLTKLLAEDVPTHNTIEDCWIHHCGSVHPSGTGVLVMQSNNNTIRHNEINNIAYHGVSHGWSWSSAKMHYHDDCLYANNYIHGVAQLLGDAAGIYTLGIHKNTIFRENWLDNIYKAKNVIGVVSAWGLDAKSSGFLFERNVIDRTQGLGFFAAHQRTRQTWVDNNFDVQHDFPLFGHKPEWELDRFTLAAEFTFREPIPGGARQWLVGKNRHEHVTGHYGLLLKVDRPGAVLNYGGQGKRLYVWSDRPPAELSITTLVATYDGSTLRLYQQGELVGSAEIPNARPKGNGKMAVAARPDGHNKLKNGGVNHVRMWSKVLTEPQIRDLILAGRDEDQAGLVFEWSQTSKADRETVDFDAIRKQAGPREPYLTWLRGK